MELHKMNIPPERIMEIFGHTRPKRPEVEAFKEMVWRQSFCNRRHIRRTVLVRNVLVFMDDIGYYPVLDYQVRERQIRFANETLLAGAIMSGLENFISDLPRWPDE